MSEIEFGSADKLKFVLFAERLSTTDGLYTVKHSDLIDGLNLGLDTDDIELITRRFAENGGDMGFLLLGRKPTKDRKGLILITGNSYGYLYPPENKMIEIRTKTAEVLALKHPEYIFDFDRRS